MQNCTVILMHSIISVKINSKLFRKKSETCKNLANCTVTCIYSIFTVKLVYSP